MSGKPMVRLVSGRHPETPVPGDAESLGLIHRFALVLDTHREGVPHMVFDHDLFQRMIGEIDASLDADRCAVRLRLYEPERDLTLASISELGRFYESSPDDFPGPPDRLEWEKDGKITALGVTERWDLVGGPHLYHDSITFSLYTRESHAEALAGLVRAAGEEAGAEVSGVLEAPPRGNRWPWLKRRPKTPPWVWIAVAVILGLIILAVSPITSLDGHGRQARNDAVLSTLRGLAAAQDAYSWDHDTYAADPAALAEYGWLPDRHVEVTILDASDVSWSASARHVHGRDVFVYDSTEGAIR